MRVFLTFFALLMALTATVEAQERFFTLSGGSRSDTGNAKHEAQIRRLDDQHEKVKVCGKKGMMFAPGHAKADSSGCLSSLVVETDGDVSINGDVTVPSNHTITTLGGTIKKHAVATVDKCQNDQKLKWNGNSWSCVDEQDPSVGLMQPGKWCIASAGQIICNQAPPALAGAGGLGDIADFAKKAFASFNCASGQVLTGSTSGIRCVSDAGGAGDALAINDLADVSTGVPALGDVLTWTGATWVAQGEGDPTVETFAKSVLPTCGAGYVLTGNGTSLSCVSVADIAADSLTLGGLSDVSVSAVVDGQFLVFDGASATWVPGDEQDPLVDTFALSASPDFSCAADELLTGDNTVGLSCVNAAAVAGSGLFLNNLQDVTLTTPVVDEILAFDGTGWVNTHEKDPNVRPFAHVSGTLVTCGANQVITSNGTTLSCVNDAGSGADPLAFVDLSDTPANFTGAGGQTVRVNAGGTALEFVDPAFVDLSDTPATLTGNANQLLGVNAGGTAVEFKDPTTIAVAGANTQVQFNDAGSMGADAEFVYDKTANRLGIGGAPSANLDVTGNAAISTDLLVGNTLAVATGGAAANAALQVSGTLIISDGSEACDGNREGGIRYNWVSQALDYCDGAGTWEELATTAGAASAAGSDTQILFNDGGVIGANANFVYDKVNARLGIGSADAPLANVHISRTTGPATVVVSSGDATSYLQLVGDTSFAGPPSGLLLNDVNEGASDRDAVAGLYLVTDDIADSWFTRNDLMIHSMGGNAHVLADANVMLRPQGTGVGINTGNAVSATLHVGGTMIISNGGEACDGDREGGLRYNTTGNEIEYCDGAGTWAALASSASLFGGAINDLSDSIYDGSSLFMADGAGVNDDGGNQNVGIGPDALEDNVSGERNVAVGRLALNANQSGSYNTSVGAFALDGNVAGSENVAIGGYAIGDSDGTHNVSRTVAIGYRAGYDLTTGADMNVFIGHRVGETVQTGKRNILIGAGVDALAATNDSLNIGNTIYGDLSTGSIGIGKAVQNAMLDVSGTLIISNGGEACDANREGGLRYDWTDNTIDFCDGAGTWAALATSSAAVTSYTGLSDTPADFSAGAGAFVRINGAGTALEHTTADLDDLSDGRSDSSYVYLGSGAGAADTGASGNVGVGASALAASSSGAGNVAVGSSAQASLVDSFFNTAVGHQALQHNEHGSNNVALGYLAGEGANGASDIGNNVFLGYSAGKAVLTGANDNTFVGYQAGDATTTGARNILIGSGVDAPTATTSDHLNIGNAIYGNLSSGSIGIGKAVQNAMLDVSGTLIISNGGEACDAAREGGLRYNWSTDAVEFCDGAGSWAALAASAAAVTNFTGLGDTPANFTGAGGQTVRVNSGATALEFVTPNFVDNGDTPANYTGAGGQTVRVNAGGTALEFVDPAFVDLSDTPANFTGAGGQFARVNAGATALEFGAIAAGDLPAISLTDLSNVSATLPGDGEVLAWVNGNNQWEPITLPSGVTTFIGLSDTPANFTGAAGQIAVVNAGETGLEFVSKTVDIVADADADTKIQVEESNDEDIIRFDTTGVERMVIDATGKIGIGTDTPAYDFDISRTGASAQMALSSATGSSIFRLEGSTNFGSYPLMRFREMDTGTTIGDIGIVSAGLAAASPMERNDFYVDADIFHINSGSLVTSFKSGGVGIGSTSPNAYLDVSGTIIISNGGEACDADREGGLRYNWSVDAVEFCDGTGSWAALATSAAAAAAAGADTQVQFNDGGAFGAEAAFRWDKANDRLLLGAAPDVSGTLAVDGDVYVANGGVNISNNAAPTQVLVSSDSQDVATLATTAGTGSANTIASTSGSGDTNIIGMAMGTGNSNVNLMSAAAGVNVLMAGDNSAGGVNMVWRDTGSGNAQTFMMVSVNDTIAAASDMSRNDTALAVSSGQRLHLMADSGIPLTVTSTGTGIGTMSPSATLDVSGTLIISNGGEACDADREGGLRYNWTSDAVEFCQGTTWTELAAGAAFGGAINDLSDGISDGSSVFLGASSGVSDDGGNDNTGVGAAALWKVTSGRDNVAIGRQSGRDLVGASNNTFVGSGAGMKFTSGGWNTGLGYQSLYNNELGGNNVAIGERAGQGSSVNPADFTGTVAIGSYAGGALETGADNNVLIGRSVTQVMTTGTRNVVIGYNAGKNLTTGADNVILGMDAASRLSIGSNGAVSNSVIIGTRAGRLVESGAGNNIAIGYQAGDNITTGSNNIVIGHDIDAVNATGDAQLNIGNAIYGDLTAGAPKIGISTTAPTAELEVNGQIKATEVIFTSDKRFKENITPIEGALHNISKLEGVTYTWNQEDFPEKTFKKGTQVGLIAQDVEKIYPEVVTTANDEMGSKAVNYAALVAPLIEAVKELSAKVDAQDAEIEALKKELREKE